MCQNLHIHYIQHYTYFLHVKNFVEKELCLADWVHCLRVFHYCIKRYNIYGIKNSSEAPCVHEIWTPVSHVYRVIKNKSSSFGVHHESGKTVRMSFLIVEKILKYVFQQNKIYYNIFFSFSFQDCNVAQAPSEGTSNQGSTVLLVGLLLVLFSHKTAGNLWASHTSQVNKHSSHRTLN